jgi:CO dehydrogenase nickel-insertion accessory protein CooC1
LLGSVSAEGSTIVADLEAGIGTLSRLAEAAVDVTVIVVEPTPRSIDVARRAVAVAEEQHHGRVVLVANKLTDGDDRQRVRDAFPDVTMIEIPADPAVDEADRLGVSPVDHDPGSPAVTALEGLAAVITED